MRRCILLAPSLLAGCAGLLAGCSGKPTTYLALAPVPGAVSNAVSNAASGVPGPPLTVARVALPASIDRLYLTTATGPTTLAVANHARWIAPLGGQAQETLAADLAARLPATSVIRPGDPVPSGGARLVMVNVTRFLPQADGTVTLNAGWRVTARRHHRVLAAGRATIVVPAGAAPAAKAAGMSAAIGRLADIIVQRLTR